MSKQDRNYVRTDKDPFVFNCPSWCENARHTIELAADRTFFSERKEVELELHDLVVTKDDDGELSFEVEVASLYLQQHYREADPHIWLGIGESRVGFTLTVNEASQLANALTSLVGMAHEGAK